MTKEEAISIISGYEAYGCGYCLQGGEEVEEALRLAVDALRQEIVIRCKNCKYYTGYECQRSKISNIRVITDEDDYCSRAERKEEYDCNDCYYSMQNCKDRSICCEDETALCDNFEPVVEKE